MWVSEIILNKNILETIPEIIGSETIPEKNQETIPETVPETILETIPETIPETILETISETIPETISETAPEFELSDEEFDIQFAETEAKIENEGWEPEGEEELIAAEPAPEETVIAFDDDLGKGFCRRRKF